MLSTIIAFLCVPCSSITNLCVNQPRSCTATRLGITFSLPQLATNIFTTLVSAFSFLCSELPLSWRIWKLFTTYEEPIRSCTTIKGNNLMFVLNRRKGERTSQMRVVTVLQEIQIYIILPMALLNVNKQCYKQLFIAFFFWPERSVSHNGIHAKGGTH